MRQEEKLKILNRFLAKYGLDINDPDVHDFLYAERKTFTDQVTRCNGYSLGTGLIRSSSVTVLPTYFENSGYNHSGTRLIDWFMYENASANPFVFNNIGDFKFDIVESYVNTKKVYPIVIDNEGNIFNNGDGNHRLLTIMLQYFVEQQSARGSKAHQRIDDKYKMTLQVDYLHKRELIELLGEEKFNLDSSNKESTYPYMIRKFREDVASQEDFLVTYNSRTKQYKYDFNGDTFEGTSEQLIKFLKTKKQSKIMTFNKGETYYISSSNVVLRTKDERKYNKMLKDVKEMAVAKKEPYLVVKDMDTNTYDIVMPPIYIAKPENRKKYMEFFIKNKIENGRFILKEKSNVDIAKIKNEFEFCKVGDFMCIDEIKYRNLTKSEYERLLPIIKKECEFIKNTMKTDETSISKGHPRYKFN